MNKTTKYNKFILNHKDLCKSYNIKNHCYNETVNSYFEDEDGIQLPKSEKLFLIKGKLNLSLEAIHLLFRINGHDKNLLLFLITYCVNLHDCSFTWNQLVYEHYAKFFHESTGKDKPTFDVIRQSVSSLLKANVIQKKSQGFYMINPLLVVNQNYLNRKKLLEKYAKLSENEYNKNIIDRILPDV